MNLMRLEIPEGCQIKYEIKNGEVYVDRVVALGYPYAYGYLENTLAADGDALDVILLTKLPIMPGALVKVEPVGVMEMIDNGQEDHKILAVIEGTEYGGLESEDTFMLKHFFSTYKTGVQVGKIYDTDNDRALVLIKDAKADFEAAKAMSK